MNYYIYHIPGVKIGCTNDLEKRMADQGFTNWEILETHTDGWLAGDREIELQKQYGYRVDKSHYMISVQNRRVWTNEDRIKAKQARPTNHQFNASASAAKLRLKLTKKQCIEIQNLYNSTNTSQRKLAKQFNVSQGTIYKIVNNQDTKFRS